MTSSHAKLVRGARVRIKAGSNPAPSSAGSKHEESAAQTPRASAYILAMANIHKPWARRWMDRNGYRWASGIYRERQKGKRSDDERTT